MCVSDRETEQTVDVVALHATSGFLAPHTCWLFMFVPIQLKAAVLLVKLVRVAAATPNGALLNSELPFACTILLPWSLPLVRHRNVLF